jgi:alkylated DNA repair dioxygenase AlkB
MDSAKEILIQTDEGIAYIIRKWYGDDGKEAMEKFKELPWTRQKLKMYGVSVYEARSTLNCGKKYSFNSAIDLESAVTYPLSEGGEEGGFALISLIKQRLENELGFEINNCVLNYYIDGKEHIGYHHDKRLADMNFVSSVSFGGSRDFYLRNEKTKEVVKTRLDDGDLFVMYGDTNNIYKHSIPKRAKAEPRISLTYRKIK